MALTGKPGLGKKRKIQHFFTNINPNEGTLDVTGGKNLSAETEKVSSTVQVSIRENVELYFNWKETYIEISGGSRALSRQIKSENIHVIEEKEKARKTDLRKAKKHGD